MKKPYTVCHIMSSVDQRISGRFMDTLQAEKVAGIYARIRGNYQADALLYGTVTTREFVPGPVPSTGAEPISDAGKDYLVSTDAGFFFISIDPQEEIGWPSGIYRRKGCPDAHVIEVLTEDTSVSYRTFLQHQNISYILAGKHDLDCKLMKEKLFRYFNIKKILLCGGGTINQTFLEQDEIDELSLVIAPVIDNTGAAKVFQQTKTQTRRPVSMHLKTVQTYDEGILHLVYTLD